MAAAIGALRVTLGADTAQFQAGMRRSQMIARTTGQSIERSMRGMSLRTSQAFAGMRVAASGLGLVLGAGLLVNWARQAANFAASLTETARSIGLTVEQLQIMRRGAIENGASIEGMERSVAIFNRTLGQAQGGSRAAVDAFRQVGITREQIQSFNQAGDAIPALMDGIRSLSTVAQQGAAMQALMGRASRELIPWFAQGAAGYNQVAQAARAAGLLTAEQAARADEAKDAIDLLAESLKTRLAIALADNIPVIQSLISNLNDLIASASTAMGWLSQLSSVRSTLNDLSDQGAIALSYVQQAMRPESGATGELERGRARARIFGRGAAGTIGSAATAVAVGQGIGRPRVRMPRDTGNRNLDLGGGGGGSRARDTALRDEAEFQTEMRRFRIDQLREQQQQTRDEVVRNQLAQEILALEDEQYRADITLKVNLHDLTKTRAAQLLAAHSQLVEEQGGTLALERSRTLLEEEADLSDQRFDIASEALRDQAAAAETASERRDAELALLDLTYRHQRAKLEEIILAERTTGHERDRAQQELASLAGAHARQREGVIRGTRGPLGDFLAELPTTAARANEALQRVAADGLSSITDGLADAIMMTRSWGDVFKNVAKQILADLLRIQIQRTIIGPLTGALSGLLGGAGGGSGLGLGGVGASIGTRAAGGPVLPGRTYLIGEKGPELLRMGGHGQVISNDNIGGGGVVIHQTFAPNFAGNAATKQEMVQLAGMVKPMAIEAFKDFASRR